ncbi:MAG: caspase family protein [Thermoanaerobaculia bacterium]
MGRLRSASVFLAMTVAVGMSRPAQGQPDAPKKYAILIGLNHYLAPRVAELKYATDDARELKKVLDQQGYDQAIVLLDSDAERNKIVAHLSRMAVIVRPQDTFLLYFAGHGLRSRIGKTPTYWLTYDANVEQLEVAGIRLSHLLDYVADIKATKKIVILDHCFSGDLVMNAQALADVSRAPDSNAATIEPVARPGIPNDVFNATAPIAGSGTLVIAAARGFAYELASTGHGVLTTALLKALTTRVADTNGDQKVSAFELMTYLKAEVERLSNHTQEIQTWLEAATNTEKWMVAENLSVDTGEARQTAIKYNGQLVVWQLKQLISLEDTQNGALMLDTWVSSFGTGRALTDNEKAVMDNFRKVMDDKTRADNPRASLAKAYIDAFFAR